MINIVSYLKVDAISPDTDSGKMPLQNEALKKKDLPLLPSLHQAN